MCHSDSVNRGSTPFPPAIELKWVRLRWAGPIFITGRGNNLGEFLYWPWAEWKKGPFLRRLAGNRKLKIYSSGRGDRDEINRSGNVFARGHFRDRDHSFSFVHAKTRPPRRSNCKERASTKSQRSRKETAEPKAESHGLFGWGNWRIPETGVKFQVPALLGK